MLRHKYVAEKANLDCCGLLKSQTPHQVTHFSTKPITPILSKYFFYMGSKHLSIETYGDHSHSNPHSIFPREQVHF